MARGRSRRGGEYGEFWPAYVDVLSTLLLVVTFLMSIFMISVMTRVLRDLRAVARGELEVRDAHEHLEEGNHDA